MEANQKLRYLLLLQKQAQAQGSVDDGTVNADTSPIELPELPPRVGKFGTPLGVQPEHDEEMVTAAGAGVIYNEAAPSGHALASLAYSQKDELEAFRISNEGTPVRLGENTGQIEYFRKDDNRWSLANSVFLGFEDVEGSAGTGIVMASELLGGLPGVAAANPALVTVGAGGGAFAGEILRLGIGQQLGINQEMTTEDMLESAAWEAGFSMAGGIVAEKVMKYGRVLADMVGGRHIPKDVRKSLEMDDSAYSALQEQINSKLSETRLKLNLAQTTGDNDLLRLQEIFEKKAQYAGEYREYSESQQDALQEYIQTINSPYKTRQDLTNTGESVASAAQNIVDNTTGRQTYFTAEAKTKLDMTVGAIKSVPHETFGETIRPIVSAEYRDFKAQAKTMADNISKAAGEDQFIKNSASHTAVKAISEEAKRSLFKGLKVQKESLVKMREQGDDNPLLVPGKDGDAGLEVDEADISALEILATPDTTMTYAQAHDGLSYLKRLKRASESGLSHETPEVGDIKRLISALETDLRDSIKGKDIEPMHEEFMRFYAEKTAMLNRGVIGKIMKKSGPEGRYYVDDEKVFHSVFSGAKRNAEQLYNVIHKSPEALKGVKDSLADVYKRVAIKEGRINETGHKRFLERYGKSAKVFLDKKEYNALVKGPHHFDRVLLARELKEQKVLKEIQDTFEYDISKLRPTQLMGMMMDSTKHHDQARLMNLISDFPDIQRGVRSHYLKYMESQIVGPHSPINGRSGAYRRLSPANLHGFIYGKGASGNREASIRSIMGDQYLDDLKVLDGALQATATKIPNANTSNTAFWEHALNSAVRVKFGPISKQGHAMRRILELRSRAAETILYNAIMDPDKTRLLLGAIQRREATLPQLQRLFATMGVSYLFHESGDR